MKKFFLTTALVALVMPAMAQQFNYSVSGTYDKDGKTIYLIDKLTDKAIDSTIVADNKFAFSGTADMDACWQSEPRTALGVPYFSTTAHQ